MSYPRLRCQNDTARKLNFTSQLGIFIILTLNQMQLACRISALRSHSLTDSPPPHRLPAHSPTPHSLTDSPPTQSPTPRSLTDTPPTHSPTPRPPTHSTPRRPLTHRLPAYSLTDSPLTHSPTPRSLTHRLPAHLLPLWCTIDLTHSITHLFIH